MKIFQVSPASIEKRRDHKDPTDLHK